MKLDEVNEGHFVYIRQYGKVKDKKEILRFIEITGASRETEIEIVSNKKGLPLIIRVKGNKIAISKELAKNIEVGRGRNK